MKSNQNLQTEIDAAFLYKILAETEDDENIAEIFKEMSAIETSHALAFARQWNIEKLPLPSTRARILKFLSRIFGSDFLLGILLDTEKKVSHALIQQRKKSNSPENIMDATHVTILKQIMNHPGKIHPGTLARFEKKHRTVGGNALRAAVLGGNDGLVSNFSLVMGVAGAMSNQNAVLLTGMAGLLAGALSMAMGEWISVKSSQELYESQMDLEMAELEINPDGEEQELALIYRSKGIPKEQAAIMAKQIVSDPTKAHEVLIREELGFNPEDIQGSAMEAALSSFFLFAIGAIIPVIPFFFSYSISTIWISCVLSAIGLFAIGASITLFTGKSIWLSGGRQLLFGLAAAGISYGIGHYLGVSLNG